MKPKMKSKQIIKLTENDIHQIIKETIRQFLSGGNNKNIYDITFISYGLNQFDADKFNTPTFQSHINKPRGGFWASPVDSNYGWRAWCIDNEFNKKALSQYILFKLKKNANIYIIDNKDDMDKIAVNSEYSEKELNHLTNLVFDENPQFDRNNQTIFNAVKNHIRKTDRPTTQKVMDFNYLYNNYDGVFVTENAASTLRWMNDNVGLHSWDVESLCVFNPNAIEIIDKTDDKYAYHLDDKDDDLYNMMWDDDEYDYE